MAITSKNINLVQLDNELGNQGLVADFNDKKNKIIQPAENSTITETELTTAIDSHIAMPELEPTVEQKLASVGLNLDDLKTALGL